LDKWATVEENVLRKNNGSGFDELRAGGLLRKE
jgi:hypothetical protein